jgi:hypothetical protein
MRPVPNDLREAFYQAVIELHDWRLPAPEPTVVYGLDHFPTSAICGFVNNEHFAPDEMPAELVGMILDLRKHDPNNPVLRNRTFQAGARYVIEVIEQRIRERQEVDRMTGRTRND